MKSWIFFFNSEKKIFVGKSYLIYNKKLKTLSNLSENSFRLCDEKNLIFISTITTDCNINIYGKYLTQNCLSEKAFNALEGEEPKNSSRRFSTERWSRSKNIFSKLLFHAKINSVNKYIFKLHQYYEV